MMKDEHLDIREWLAYHQAIGIDKVYLFDNGSKPPLIHTILDYVNSGDCLLLFMLIIGYI